MTEVSLRHDALELVHTSLPPGKYVIGRSPDAQICANTPLISRWHARLTIDGGDLFLEDLGSSNGTFVNDEPVTGSTLLLPDCGVRLGPDVVLEIRRGVVVPEDEVGAAPDEAGEPFEIPQELLAGRRYAVGAEVARGGMGAILQALQEATHRTVAMKVMLDTASGEDVRRFVEEAQVTAQLDHPNIVPIYELGIDEEGRPFYTMKLVRGITLQKVLQLLAEGVEATVKKYPLPALLTLFQKACDAVAFAHAKGVIHRDLKPENIMIGDFGSVLVMDWGLAKFVGQATVSAGGIAGNSMATSRTGLGDPRKTRSGTIMGTPQYMSPEQARGEVDSLDTRSDVFSLGAILFHLLHLRPVVAGDEIMEMIEKVSRGEFDWTPPKKPAPESLLAVCRKALSLETGQRYASVEDIQHDLAAYQAGFATTAEQANWFRRALLAVKRNAVPSLAGALGLMVVVGFGTKAVVAGRRANLALAELRKAAPTFAAQAQSLVEQHRFEDALGTLSTAIALDPTRGSYLVQRANIFQTLERYPESAAAYRAALRHEPSLPGVRQNLALTESLAGEAAGSPENAKRALAHLQAELTRQGRTAEAVFLSKSLAGDGIRNYETWKPVIQGLGLRTDTAHYRAEADGTLLLLTDDPSFSDLRPIRGMPLGALNISRSAVLDLSPLAGMPLTKLDLGSCPQITDVSALRGLPLRSLNIGHTNVTDLAPLQGMKLEELLATPMNASIRELQPLTGMALKKITICAGEGADFSVFAPMPLEEATFYDVGLSDLSFLRQAPLRKFFTESKKVTDLRPLRGKALTRLMLNGTQVADLEPLHGMPLTELGLARTLVSDLSPLAGLPLKSIVLDGCQKIHDLSVLATIPTLESVVLPASGCDLAPLRRLPNLKYLSYRFSSSLGRPAQTAEEFWAENAAASGTAPQK